MVFCGAKFYVDADLYYVMGNSFDDGTAWCIKAVDLSPAYIPVDAIVHDGQSYIDELCELCWKSIIEARECGNLKERSLIGLSGAAWWLGWHYEGKRDVLSAWMYVLSARLNNDSYGWVLDRLYDDISLFIKNRTLSEYELFCLDEIDEFYGGDGSVFDSVEKAIEIKKYYEGDFSAPSKLESRPYSLSWTKRFVSHFRSLGYKVNTQFWALGDGYIIVEDVYFNSRERSKYNLASLGSCERYLKQEKEKIADTSESLPDISDECPF